MGEGDKAALIAKEFRGGDHDDTTLSRDRARSELIISLPYQADQSICPPLHRMHEHRVVRKAGRMLIGFRMPAPAANEAFVPHNEGYDVSSVFYSEERGGGAVSRAVLAMTCAFALAGAAVVADRYVRSDHSVPPTPDTLGRDVAADAAPAMSVGKPVQIMAMSAPVGNTTKVASISPAVVSDPSAPSESGFVRVAQKDSPGLGATNVFGPAGAPIRLPISLNGARAEDYSFLMFRGLPPEVTLSAGFRLKESWAVSLRDIENLTLETPEQFQGNFRLEILLIKGRDTPAESRVITVEVVPANIQLPPSIASRQQEPGPQLQTAAPRIIEPVERAVSVERAAPPSVKQPAPSKGLSASISPQQEEMMMKKAVGLMENKDMVSARLMLEHLAKNGSARAALVMGKTFDPAYMQANDMSGLKPDIAKARQWYSRAAELGDGEAPSRLNGLASR